MKKTEARAEAKANLVGECYCHECMAGERRIRECALGCGLAAAEGDIYCEGCGSSTGLGKVRDR